MSTVEQDLQTRWVPSAEQLEHATKLFETLGPERDPKKHYVVVSLAQPGKEYGFWTEGQEVVSVEGAWLAVNAWEDEGGYISYSKARQFAAEAAREWLIEQGKTGTVAWVSIHHDGTWAVFEDFGSKEDD